MKRFAILFMLVSVVLVLNASIGWSGNIWPNEETFHVPGNDLNVYYQIWKDGVTNSGGQGAGITATFYYRLSGETVYNSVAMTYNGDVGSNDEYTATIPGGTYIAGDIAEFYCEGYDTTDETYSYGTDQNGHGPFTAAAPGEFFYGDPLGQDVTVTFRVDMSVAGVEGAISVAGSFNGWAVGANTLTDQGGNIYAGDVLFSGGSTPYIEYKFVNGSTWEGAIANRQLEIDDTIPTMVLDIVYFNDDDGSLPVEFSSFEAVLTSENYVLLEWVTQSESDMMGYQVYRSANDDIADAYDMGFVEANNISAEQVYQFTDGDIQSEMTYYYWLEAKEMSGQSRFHGPVQITILEDGEEGGESVPSTDVFAQLNQNHPNPFNPSTEISFYIAESSEITLKVYNMKGQLINTLIDHQQRSGGQIHRVSWEPKDQPSGIYFYQLTVGESTFTRKMLMLK